MNEPKNIRVMGIPEFIPKSVAVNCESKLVEAIQALMQTAGLKDLNILVGTMPNKFLKEQQGRSAHQSTTGDELSIEERALQYRGSAPLYDFDFLVLPEEVKETLLNAVELIRLESKVFDEWNLRKIEPFPCIALNFHGHPGTGKTLAAHALAQYIQRPILATNYAHIESKYHGEGAKNVEALFYAARRDGAVLFIDEADSLVSRRLTSVNQGAEHAINSMRTQLLLNLERFHGVTIFATNFIESYDRAFETRMRHIRFPMPDRGARELIWKKHLPAQLPLTPDVSVACLAEIDEVCGRDIKNAVIDAALKAARKSQKAVEMADLSQALLRIKSTRIENGSGGQGGAAQASE
ncbi:MAG: ATP-binding protein [Acidobacteria bacterium]|nr:ATP-binding protein [Acidobacteriota bacterium]